ncbi:isoflavone reductase [Coniochaeta sp. 2T2.1]|nr:isoflavone reductase [Coniochaeta sp. 2T2.1]
MSIKTVAVVGASGNVGTPLVRALLDAGFAVTAITRPASTATFPSEVEVRRADPNSVDELTAALSGQDAVVSATATEVVAFAGQNALVDAAVAAGVRRFIASEFGHNLERFERFADGKMLRQMLEGKARTAQYVEEKARENPGFTWTGVGTSGFFDWGLDTGVLGIHVKDRKATIYDSGNEVFSTCDLPHIGRAVAQVLKHDGETKNKFVEVVQYQTNQNAIVKTLGEVLGEKVELTHVKTEDVEKEGHEKLAKGDGGGAFGETANALLGLPAPQTDVRPAVEEYVRSRGVKATN